MKERESWFRQWGYLCPWAVYPIHWKGWTLQILGPVAVVLFCNFAPVPPVIDALVLVGAIAGFMFTVYTHTEGP